MARSKGDKEEVPERHIGLLNLAQTLSFLVVFVAGIILGLTSSSHFDRSSTSKTQLFFTSNVVASAKIPAVNCTLVKPCGRVDCLSIENFTHPKNLTHGMTDDQLFWRASLVPFREGYPFRRVPKVAFMFLTRGPLPLMPLWERFFKGHEEYLSIYVHGPRGFVLNVSSDSVFYRKEIPSQNVAWGSVSLVDAEKRLLANALLDFSNERFVLLSESCIPIYNFSTVYKYLIGSKHSFVESYDDPSRNGRGRYSRHMLPDIHLRHWRKGSQWFEIQRTVAVYLLADTKYYHIFKKHCKPACYPDEHYIPTYLNMFHGTLNSNRTVTWVDWSILGPHPATYRADNITENFLLSLRNNGTNCKYNSGKTSICYLFARKFDPSTLQPLLDLTSTVLEF